MTKVYHKMYAPRRDVFSLSGSSTLDHFIRDQDEHPGQQNLVVIPTQLIRELDAIKRDDEGADDTLKFLKKRAPEAGEGGVGVVELTEGLDIAFIYNDSYRNGHEESRDGRGSRLEERVLEERVLEGLVKKRFRFEEGEQARLRIITNDARAHIELAGRGMSVADPGFLQVDAGIVHRGIIVGNQDLLARLRESSDSLPLDQATHLLGGSETLYPRQFVKFPGERGYEYARVIPGDEPVLAMLSRSEYQKRLRVGTHVRDAILGIRPRDMEQYIALQYGLLDQSVEVFFLTGTQGCGKTLLSYVAAVDLVLSYEKEMRTKRNTPGDHGFYRHIILLKPPNIMGGKSRDIGFLPGSVTEKLMPHLQPYIDAHAESILGNDFPFEEMLHHPRYPQDGFKQRSPEIIAKKYDGGRLPPFRTVEMPHAGFIRGRSYRNALILIDEAQNFTPYEVKTIIERAGQGCKIIIMGDPLQTDNPACSRAINGLTHGIRHYLEKEYTALVHLGTNYRSSASRDAQSWRVFGSR